jgi:hypothetical protein
MNSEIGKALSSLDSVINNSVGILSEDLDSELEPDNNVIEEEDHSGTP